MSDIFMDTHRRRWQHYSTPPLSPTASTVNSNSTSPSTRIHVHKNNYKDFENHDHEYAHSKQPGVAYTAGQQATDQEDNDDDDDDDDGNNDSNPFANILSLKLKKPKNWKWELTTSKSCTNIALPRILLYDHKGTLLVDAKEGAEEQVYKQEENTTQPSSSGKKKTSKRAHTKASTTNFTHSIHKILEEEFNGLQIQEVSPSPEFSYTPWNRSASSSRLSHRSRRALEFDIADLPDHYSSGRSSSLRNVRFNVHPDKDDDYHHSQIPEFLPTPPSTTTPTTASSSSGPREKRRYKRSHSSGKTSLSSNSILERFSLRKGRLSSSPESDCAQNKPEREDEELHLIHRPRRYFYSTTEAGTLIVQEESFKEDKHPMRRRRRKSRKSVSSESLLRPQSTQQFSPTPSIAHSSTPQRSSIHRSNENIKSKTIGPSRCSCTYHTVRRYLSDGNSLAATKTLASSDDELGLVKSKDKDVTFNINKLRKTPHQNEDLKFPTASNNDQQQHSGKMR